MSASGQRLERSLARVTVTLALTQGSYVSRLFHMEAFLVQTIEAFDCTTSCVADWPAIWCVCTHATTCMARYVYKMADMEKFTAVASIVKAVISRHRRIIHFIKY